MAGIWITGASGFSGGYLLKALAEAHPGTPLLALTRQPAAVPGAAQTLTVDLADTRAVTELAQRFPPTQVYHLAGAMPPAAAELMWSAFVTNTYSLLQGLDLAGCHDTRVLSVGSAAEYQGNDSGCYRETDRLGGANAYGRAKTAQSLLALAAGREFGIEVVIARPFNLIGPGLSRNFVLAEICAQLAAGPATLELGNLDAERDFVDVRDVVRGMITVMAQGRAYDSYNLCSGQAMSIRAMVDLALTVADAQPALTTAAARQRGGELNRVYGDADKAAALGWAPHISLATSVADMMMELRP